MALGKLKTRVGPCLGVKEEVRVGHLKILAEQSGDLTFGTEGIVSDFNGWAFMHVGSIA